ncbi:ABC transporter ATP-binding protein [Synechococcus sp. BMK-MC-1]|uniref:ABC transporter ATP-binding protein n=1 Tax=Synechococcus sp. BMK-MC-1 TaxID=1442551 RepID=UPI0021022507|nr:ABC transporter ATP-binding protein [Synechococcus sp. BMK-MC-1]
MKSSSVPPISVNNLGKCFQIYDNPKARLKQAIWRGRRQYYKEFWALQDVNFELSKGESLGVIGRNGSGKSTLLQLICGTLTPTTGDVDTHGRIAALLELGSGFNPEFTGIENVFLNASMLGLSKEETSSRLDDILAFADIGDFVDQPVKAYSSGMAVRLAFAVIAHVNADILIVDEALSVGDVFFNQKCMRFINRFRENGSLLFVSHDASAVTSLCDRALLLDRGQQISLGTPKEILDEYTRQLYASSQTLATIDTKQAEADGQESYGESTWIDYRSTLINSSKQANLLKITQFSDDLLSRESFGNGKASIIDAKLMEAHSKQPLLCARGGERVILQIEAKAAQAIEKPIVGFILKNAKGMTMLGDNTLNSQKSLLGDMPPAIDAGDLYHTEFEFTLPMLQKGHYSLTLSLAEGNQEEHDQLQWMNDALILESINSSIAAGLAGVPMHRIDLRIEKNSDQQA